MGLSMDLYELRGDEFDDTLPAISWGKANHIHGWFVRNVCDGEDDTDYYYTVSREQLRELADACREVMASDTKTVKKKGLNGSVHDVEVLSDTTVAERILPCTGGCWFGSQEYDWFYLFEVRRTAKLIDDLLNETPEDVSFVYGASW